MVFKQVTYYPASEEHRAECFYDMVLDLNEQIPMALSHFIFSIHSLY